LSNAWKPGAKVKMGVLTPPYEKQFLERRAQVEKFGEQLYDRLTNCEYPGVPRWLWEPYIKEFVNLPDQSWFMNDMMNETRRIYIGAEHVNTEAKHFPLGDSIGFWDGNKLVIHTSQMRAGQYQRIQPYYTEQVETVEIWQKADDDTMAVDIWSFDPPALAEPWYTKQIYKRLSNDDKSLRIRYWDCGENQNNTVTKTATGSSDFSNFTFTNKDDK